MRRKVIVVGGGTAGLISAITLLRLCPHVSVTVIRSSKLGHIMVGEGTFAATPIHLHDVLGIPRAEFYEQVNPTWKLGLRLLWGPRPYFDYPFNERISSQILPSLHEPWGYYCLDDWKGISPTPAVCEENLPKRAGYHMENQPLVEFLERHFTGMGGRLIDAKLVAARTSEKGIDNIQVESGDTHEADLFVDASGFAGELIHKRLGEPQVNMRDHLFCDKAVVAGWARQDEPIRLYTTAETMNAGWAWQIEHEKVINRGYVYSSAFVSDDEAAAEFVQKNPKINEGNLRIVPFESRHVRRAWVKNVVAVGNACGFVEPLEATNIQVICIHALRFAQALNAGRDVDARHVEAFNQSVTSQWTNVRDFLALHYRFNTRLRTAFWEMAVRDTPLGELEEYVSRYRATGPNLLTERLDMFGHDGCLAMLLGMRVPWDNCRIC